MSLELETRPKRKPPNRRPATVLPSPLPLALRDYEVMGAIGCSRSTLYRLVKAGKLRTVKVGPRGTRYTTESVLALLSEG